MSRTLYHTRKHGIKSFRLSFILLFLPFILNSCKTKTAILKDAKQVQETPQPVISEGTKIAKELAKLIAVNQLKFKTLTAKIETDLVLNNNDKTSFTANIRIKKDSAIWASISPALGLEVARALITKDTVLVFDRIHNTYFAGNFSYLNKLLNADVDYEMLEALLVGNAIDYYDDDRMKVTEDKPANRIILSSVRKRKLKKVLEEGKQLSEPLESIWVIPQTYKISRVYLDDFASARTFDVRYENFEQLDSVNSMPKKADYEIKAQKNMFINMIYSKINLNVEVSFPFKIPEKYTPMKKDE